METWRDAPWGEGKVSWLPGAAGLEVMLYGDSFLEISLLGG